MEVRCLTCENVHLINEICPYCRTIGVYYYTHNLHPAIPHWIEDHIECSKIRAKIDHDKYDASGRSLISTTSDAEYIAQLYKFDKIGGQFHTAPSSPYSGPSRINL